MVSEKQFAQAKVSIRSQIVIPQEVKKRLGGLEDGDYVLFFEDPDGQVIITKGVIKRA